MTSEELKSQLLSENEEEEDLENRITEEIQLKGILNKWTNYIHGWQERFIVLKDSTLSYYKSAEDSDFGCRGAICLEKATIKCHDIDDCRFDISVNNLVWYLRAENTEDKNNWVEVLQSFKSDINEPLTQLKRYGSTVSIQSNTFSTASGSSLKQNSRNLREKVHEVETYRDILFGQVDTLQKYFDACASSPQTGDIKLLESEFGVRTVDFKGEAITFRETSTAVITSLQHCLEIIVLKDDVLKRKLDKEVEKRKKLEEQLKQSQDELLKSRTTSIIGPDLEEGPNSTIPEDEFFDAVETGLDKIEEVRQIRVKLKLQNQQSQIDSGQIQETPEDIETDDFGRGQKVNHFLWSEIEQVCQEQLHHAWKGVGDDNSGWQLFADEGEMKMYRREEEKDGMVMDPLKSCHVVQGCTAREMCHYFFDPQYRNDWETTLEDVQILEKIAPDTLVFLQTHKRIWPANQRDALFWSHMRKIEEGLDAGAKDAWIVCNHSTRNVSYPAANQGKLIRIYLTVILLCQTFVKPKKDVDKLTRDDLTCKITYCSVVNPGGWAPAAVLRAIYKKEYPKFLKRYTGYVLEQSKNKPIKF